MDEKTHYFYGFLIGSFVLLLMSMYNTQNLNYIWLLAGDVVTILVWAVSNEYRRKGPAASSGVTSDEGQSPSEESASSEDATSSPARPAVPASSGVFERKFVVWNEAAWCCNFVMLVLTVVTADFISYSHASKVYAIIGLLVSFAGSFYCNMDVLSFGESRYRNPITHSYILPFLVWWYAFLGLSADEAFLIIFPGMFCLGAGCHLLLDTVPDNLTFVKQFEEFFNFKQIPKEIPHMPQKWQHAWLFASGVGLFACFGLCIPRFYLSDNFTWSLPVTGYFPTLATYPYLLILIVGIVGVGVYVAVLLLGWHAERKNR
jgi:lysylphosphatidylglycerol synthetase-like protein (DUF2156 family)